jgi:hypothetical protein
VTCERCGNAIDRSILAGLVRVSMRTQVDPTVYDLCHACSEAFLKIWMKQRVKDG